LDAIERDKKLTADIQNSINSFELWFIKRI
jgi:hypothetical protein